MLSKNKRHQLNIDNLLSYEGQIYIDGESYNTDVLKLLYLEADCNVCSSAVIDFLLSLDSEATRDGIVNDVLLDMSIAQQKKTRFLSELRKTRKNSGGEKPFSKYNRLCEYVIEDALSKLDLKVRLNLATKRIEVSGYGAEALFEKYSRSNILSVLPLIVLDNLRSDGVVGLGQGTKLIEQYIFNIADANRYNPIHEMLEAHENDDEGNHAVLCAMLGIYDEFDMLLVKKWFIQAVALAYNSPEKPVSSEGVLVLQGEQGCGKTSFFRRMALKPEWFTEGAVIDVRNKDSVISALSTWICELGEIDCTLKREQSALKAFITRPLDRIRFPYAPAESEMARTTSLCGTVNPDKFLNDLTGARRYWVVSVDSVAKKSLFEFSDEQIMDMWGYYYHEYRGNPEGFRLSEDERKTLERRNRVHNCELKFEAEVKELFDFDLEVDYWTKVTPAKLARFLGGVSAVQVGKILSKLSQDDERVEVSNSHNRKYYTVPLKRSIYNHLSLTESG
ncbi:MAG: virulence-associated E family protein [Ruminococcus sp.]|nr:virulence-associated E family protein [Ruminococcus sp.]